MELQRNSPSLETHGDPHSVPGFVKASKPKPPTPEMGEAITVIDYDSSSAEASQDSGSVTVISPINPPDMVVTAKKATSESLTIAVEGRTIDPPFTIWFPCSAPVTMCSPDTPPVELKSPPAELDVPEINELLFSKKVAKDKIDRPTTKWSENATSRTAESLVVAVADNFSMSSDGSSDHNERPLDEVARVFPPTPHRAQTKMSGGKTNKKATCSLNLMCYRTGTQGCLIRNIRVTSANRFTDEKSFQRELLTNKDLAFNDETFFLAIRRVYKTKMCGFWRRWLSLKTLRGIRLLSYSEIDKPEIVPLDDLTLQEIFHLYKSPSKIKSEHEWIDWVFRLRQDNRRHALQLVEGWCVTRIAIVGSIPGVAATLVGVLWVTQWGDAQTAFTVAGFILTVGTSFLALLAILSNFET